MELVPKEKRTENKLICTLTHIALQTELFIFVSCCVKEEDISDMRNSQNMEVVFNPHFLCTISKIGMEILVLQESYNFSYWNVRGKNKVRAK